MTSQAPLRTYGVTNASTVGFAWTTDDLSAALRCARTISGAVFATADRAFVGGFRDGIWVAA